MNASPADTSAGRIRVGCSGWLHHHPLSQLSPRGRPARAGVAHYADSFDTIELGSTFRRLPKPATVEHWADTAPPGFVYATKLSAAAGGGHRLRTSDTWLAEHVERVRRLDSSRGPTVVQVPPRWPRDTGRLAALLAAATSDPDLLWAVELRHPSWIDDAVLSVLADHGVALVLHDLVPDVPFVRTADWTYLRFHGSGSGRRRYRGRYGGQHLAGVADRLGPWIAEGTDVYAYFNGHGQERAWADARTLRQLLAGWS